VAAEPDRPPPLQAADDDAVAVAPADGDLVDADDPRRGAAGPAKLFPHVLLVEFLDGVPIQVQFLGDRQDGALSAPPAHVEGEPPDVEGIVRQPVELLAFHATAPGAIDPTNRELEIDSAVAAGEVAHAARPLIVDAAMRGPADPAASFFRRRRSVMTTARGSPKIPRTPAKGTKPGNL
jgi:hypothetical protein